MHVRKLVLVLSFLCIAPLRVRVVAQDPAHSSTPQASPEQAALSSAVDQIVKAKSDEEREAVLRTNSNLDLSKLLFAVVRAVGSARGATDQSLATDRWVAAVAARTNDQINLYEASLDSGMFLSMQGDHDEAIDQYQTGKTVAEKLRDADRIGHALMRLGIESDQLSDYDTALSYYAEADKQFSGGGNKSLLASVQTNTGLSYQSQGNLGHALACFRKALELDQEKGDERGMSLALANIGHLYQLQNDFVQALFWDQRAMDLFEKRQDKRSMATLLMNTGEIYRLQNKYSRALEYYENALKIQRELGLKPGEASSLDSIGLFYSDQEKYRQAIDYFEKALDLRQAMGRKLGIAESLHNLAKAHYYLKEYEQAISLDERASEIAKEIGSREVFSFSRTTAGMTYRAMGQFDKSKAALGEAIATIESLRNEMAGGEEEQQLFFTERLSPYQEMVGLLAEQGQISAALSQAEQVKGRVLLDVLSGNIARVTKAMTPAEREQESKLEANLSDLNRALERRKSSSKYPEETVKAERNVQNARIALTDFHTQAYAAHPELKVNRGQAEAISEAEIGAIVPGPLAAVAEYVVGERETFLFVLTGNGPGTVPELYEYSIPIKGDELLAAVELFRKQLSERQLGFRGSARHLYDLLLKPAEKQLRGKTELTLVPDGGLWDLPFQALQPSDQHYLLENYAISYVPSLTVLREMARRHRQNSLTVPKTLLAMGNPSLGTRTVQHVKEAYRDENLVPLPEAEKEVERLGQLYGNVQSEVFIGAEAREDRFKADAGNARMIHLATHGYLNDASPMYSHIVLSADDLGKEDGLLEAWEIMGMDLKADLVVLSACETARGRIGAGEGVVGLSWAFFVAGTPTTVVSQWKVESGSTTEIMTEFHRQRKAITLRSGSNFGTAKALRAAELRLLHSKQYSHPFYWAPFVVIGDPN